MKKYYYYYRVLYKGEIFQKVKYFLRKKTGYYLHKKEGVVSKKMTNLHLVNMDALTGLELNLFKQDEYKYDFLNQKIDVRKLYFPNNNSKIWIYEDINNYSDVKEVWEINRLQFLVPLAIQARKTNDQKIYDLIVKIIKDWEASNKYNYGVNWYSNLEVAIRAISLYLCYEITSEKLDYDFSRILYLHGKHIYEEINYSVKCTPNNHAYGEGVSLILLGKTFSEDKWINKGKKVIKKLEILLKDDGTTIENSFPYQFFLVQMHIFLLSLGEMTSEKIKKALCFLKTILKSDTKLVHFGDNDDAYFYNFFWVKSINLFLEHLDGLNGVHLGKIKKYEHFKNNEYQIINNDDLFILFNAQKEVFHSHSDALSIELSYFGRDLFCDSGTGNYNYSKSMRSYFRSSKAHNTISFNDEDHNLQVSNFRWYNRSKAYFLDDLYGILKVGKNTFKRKIEINDIVMITDEINSCLPYTLCWHFDLMRTVKKVDKYIYEIDDDLLLEIFGDQIDVELKTSFVSQKYNVVKLRYVLIIKGSTSQIIRTVIRKKD